MFGLLGGDLPGGLVPMVVGAIYYFWTGGKTPSGSGCFRSEWRAGPIAAPGAQRYPSKKNQPVRKLAFAGTLN